jgi:hypothetical protein
VHAGSLGVEDVEGMELKIHTLAYHSRTTTVPRLLRHMRKAVILDVLSQVRCCWGAVGGCWDRLRAHVNTHTDTHTTPARMHTTTHPHTLAHSRNTSSRGIRAHTHRPTHIRAHA